jgi:hypothetical protein
MNRLFSFLFFIILLIGTAPVKATHISSAELREAALKAQGLPKEQSITIISKKTYVFNLKKHRKTSYPVDGYSWYSKNRSNASTYAALSENSKEEASAYAEKLVEQDEVFILKKGDKIAIKKIYIVNEPSPPYLTKLARDDAFKGRAKLREYNAKMAKAVKQGYAWIELINGEDEMRYGVVRLLDLKGSKK